MQDGQNLSDPATAFAGTWELDATLERLAQRGDRSDRRRRPPRRSERLVEYSPFPDRRHGGGEADAYLAFRRGYAEAAHRSPVSHPRASATSTAILGSSMGGLVSLYAFFRYPSVFGRAGVMSPSIWFGQGAMLDFIEEARSAARDVLYLDVGTHEGVGTLRDARRLGRLLVKKGFARDAARDVPARRAGPDGAPPRAAGLRYLEDAGGRHQEADWACRLEGRLSSCFTDTAHASRRRSTQNTLHTQNRRDFSLRVLRFPASARHVSQRASARLAEAPPARRRLRRSSWTTTMRRRTLRSVPNG